ncbi:hypothetical protein CsSME_00036004 [Camellia sinensis var. sinensis]
MASILEPSRSSLFPAMTKIVGTLGPRSRSVEVISTCLQAGMSVGRFDFSWEGHTTWFSRIPTHTPTHGTQIQTSFHSFNSSCQRTWTFHAFAAKKCLSIETSQCTSLPHQGLCCRCDLSHRFPSHPSRCLQQPNESVPQYKSMAGLSICRVYCYDVGTWDFDDGSFCHWVS